MDPVTPQPEMQERLQNTPPSDWIIKMQKHYEQTGTYRPSDLVRVLGDTTKGVDVDQNVSLPAYFKAQ